MTHFEHHFLIKCKQNFCFFSPFLFYIVLLTPFLIKKLKKKHPVSQTLLRAWILSGSSVYFWEWDIIPFFSFFLLFKGRKPLGLKVIFLLCLFIHLFLKEAVLWHSRKFPSEQPSNSQIFILLKSASTSRNSPIKKKSNMRMMTSSSNHWTFLILAYFYAWRSHFLTAELFLVFCMFFSFFRFCLSLRFSLWVSLCRISQ